MKTFDLFPKPVSSKKYPNHKDLKKTVLKLLESSQLESNHISNKLFHYKNNSKVSLLYDEIFTDFKTWCEKTCYEYVTNVIGYEPEDKIIVTDSWLNKCDRGGYQYPHYHTNCYISGTYYLNFQEGHAPIMFRHEDSATHPHSPTITLGRTETSTRYNIDSLIYPEESELYLWQSHLTHGVPENDLDNRVSLSMNFMPTIVSNQRYGYKVFYEQ